MIRFVYFAATDLNISEAMGVISFRPPFKAGRERRFPSTTMKITLREPQETIHETRKFRKVQGNTRTNIQTKRGVFRRTKILIFLPFSSTRYWLAVRPARACWKI